MRFLTDPVGYTYLGESMWLVQLGEDLSKAMISVTNLSGRQVIVILLSR
jgi:hypothetical protein